MKIGYRANSLAQQNETFQVTVTNKDAIWFYCSLSGHCQEGMVGVVNPPANDTISQFIAAAKSAPFISAPSAVGGGTLTTLSGSAASQTADSSTGAGTLTTMASTAAASPTTKSGAGRNRGLSAVRWLGIAVLGLGQVVI